ncbi:MAG: hypothetical protein ACI4RH_03510 [Huintestinicola sp.]
MTDPNVIVCHQIAEGYGFEHQFGQTTEELCELLIALHKYKRAPSADKISNVSEEIADVLIMIEQMKHLLNIKESDIQEIIDYKLFRQMQRLHNGEK